MVTELAPSNESELQEILKAHSKIRVTGLGTRSIADRDQSSTSVRTSNFEGIIDLSPADMTSAVRSGTRLCDFQKSLAEVGLCLPTRERHGTVGGAYMASTVAGTWRDWVVGSTFMLADGTVAKSGSHAVKSVAGYDVHRFMAGTRGSLAICLHVIVRVYPITLMPQATVAQVEVPTISDPTQIALMKKTKQIFDPTNKLNPGEWGFM